MANCSAQYTDTIWTPDLSTSAAPRYVAIADAIAADVETGRLKPGDQLPTHRALAGALGVTVGTVTRGYGTAEQRGLIRGEVGRGSFVAAGVPEAVPMRVSENQPTDHVDLSLNCPIYSEDPDLGPTLARMATRGDLAPLLRYQPSEGLSRHREAGAAWVRRFGLRVGPGRVIVTAGAQHAMTAAMSTLARSGDLILTEELTYPGMKTLANLLGLRLEPVAIDREGLIPEAFEAACRKSAPRALYCIPTLHNPTTATLPDGRRKRIAAIARKYGVAVVEDDIHGLLPKETPRPIGRYVPELSYYIASMSKTVAGGLRIAFLIAPEDAVESIAQAVGATVWLASPITAEIAATWIADGTAERTLAAKRREAIARQRIARTLLGRFGLRSHPASYHAWLELPPPWRTHAFVEAARRCGVVIAPAELFAVGQDQVHNAVRISLSGSPNRELLTHALTALASLLTRAPAPGRAVV